MPQPTILTSVGEIAELESRVRKFSDTTKSELARVFADEPDGLRVLHRLKFEKVGRHPTGGHELNLIEQLNQTFTILVTLRAARWLAKKHGMGDGIRVALGTEGGHDLQSLRPGLFAAEAFAATSPTSNGKLAKDRSRLAKAVDYRHKYVFFQCPDFEHGRQIQLESQGLDVQVWCLSPSA